MKLKLEVLACASIKRKKPWPRIVWAGQEKESLFLLDSGRISVLYVPSGKTKRKIPKLSPLIEDVLDLTSTKNGLFLTGLLKSGDVFLWHKDRDFLKIVTGLSNLVLHNLLTAGSSRLCVSNDCTKVLVVLNNTHFFVWQLDPQDSIGDSRAVALSGSWMQVRVPDKIQVASPDCVEAVCSAVFYSSQVLGDCCQCSVTFNNGNHLCVSTLLLRFSQFHDIYKDSVPSIHTEWNSLQYSLNNINTGCEPINAKGAFVTCYSNDGQVLALAANQKGPSKSSLLFVSPLTETVLVSEMRGCGTREADKKSGKYYWVADLAWTSENLFVACILKNGSVCLMSRLGEPLAIQTFGCSVDMGPARFLPLHPVIRIQQETPQLPAETEIHASPGEDPLQQKFSVSTHPSLPILLFSDGYMVSVLQLPSDLTCMTFMRDLVIDSSKHLQHIQEQKNFSLTLASAYNLPADRAEMKKAAVKKKERLREATRSRSPKPSNLPYYFEEPDSLLNETQDSEVSAILDHDAGFPQLAAMQNLSSGKIIFGEPDMMLATVDASFLSMEEQEAIVKHLQLAKLSLFTAWKLAASCSDAWTANIDSVIKHAAHNVIKLFSLILDCPEVNDLFMNSANSAAASVQNAGLFQVITMYRQLLELLQFDVFHQHLIPVVLQLTHKTASIILDSKGLTQSDPRLKTLMGCFTLLKFTERNLSRTYVWLPKSVSSKAFSPRSEFHHLDQYEPLMQSGRDNLDRPVDNLDRPVSSEMLSKRLTATWTMLYRSLIQFQKTDCQNEGEYRQAQQLLCGIQHTLQVHDTPLPQHLSPRVSSGDKLSLDGQHTQALNAWSKQLKILGANSSKAARLLHSQLYTYLLRGELMTAVDFVDSLILRANVPSGVEPSHLAKTSSSDCRLPLMTIVTDTLKTLAFDSPDMVPCIRDRSIRQVVQSMARFMAAYFANQTVYIFPPHNPYALPAIHFDFNVINNRIIPKYHEDITNLIRQGKLGEVWTVERTLEYLLLSGLTCEATWFSDKMGDWKAAFLLAVGCVQHREVAPIVYSKPRKPLKLPDCLFPISILQKKLGLLLDQPSNQTLSGSKQFTQDFVSIDEKTNIHQLTKTLGEILTAGIMGRVEVTPWLLEGLVEKLKAVVANLHPLVPQDFYLPAPPLYCPQPSSQSESSTPASAGWERKMRKKAASLIQLTLSLLNASHLSLPVVRWYVNELAQVQEKAAQFKANTEGPCFDLPHMLQQYLSNGTSLTQHANNVSVKSVLSSFRDFCAILWALHARDKLSHNLRLRETYLSKLSYEEYTKANWEVQEQERWFQECFTNLQWAVHLLTFSRFLPDEGSMYKVVLSLLLELPPSEDTADILAEYFYDKETLDAEVQEKLDKILDNWQGIVIKPEDDGKSAKVDAEDDPNDGRKSVTFFRASPRGKTLSVYFHKQCQVASKVLKKKKKSFGSYEEFVFDSSVDMSKDFSLHIGSRPFETRQSYMEFLDTFTSISFGHLLNSEVEHENTKGYPLLGPWADIFISQEITTFNERVAMNVQKKHALVVMRGSVESLPRGKDVSSYRRESPRSLFSSESANDRLTRSKGLFRSKSVVDVDTDQTKVPVRRYDSENGLDAIEELPFSAPLKSPKRGSQQNLTQLASRFSKSEEVLYKHTEENEHHFWSLNVNFGRKYMPLRHLLEWLEAWSKKHHSLGLGRKERNLELKPTMKIHIPAQLIILSLWLLENKYMKAEPVALQTESKQDSKRKGKARFSHGVSSNNNAINSRDKSPGGTGGRSVSPLGHTPPRSSLRGTRSLSPGDKGLRGSGVVEEEDVRTAYEQVLDGPDDSSSLGVSSLASDELDGELKHTLSIIRGTGSPNRQGSSFLNKTLFPKEESLNKGGNSKPLNSSTPLNTQKKHRTSSSKGSGRSQRSPSPHETRLPSPNEIKSHESRRKSPTRQSDSGLNGNIAHQLQNIVRSEMRHIMEVQHQSLIAMMGAIDAPDQQSYPMMPSQFRNPADGSQQNNSTMFLDELNSQRQSVPVRGVLKELRNLQQTSNENHLKSIKANTLGSQKRSSRDKENLSSLPLGISDLRIGESHIYHDGSHHSYYATDEEKRNVPLYDINLIPKFLRIPAEKDTSGLKLHLPRVPAQAWSEKDELQPDQKSDIPPMPLLKLDGGYAPSNLFHSIHKTPAHLPAFQTPYESRPPDSVPPPNSFLTAFPQFQTPAVNQSHSDTGVFRIPLLHIPKQEIAHFAEGQQPSFGRLVDPDLVLSHQRELHQQELEKQKLLKEFHEKQIQEQTELDEQQFGKQLLNVDFKIQQMKEDYDERKSPRRSPRRRQKIIVQPKTILKKSSDSRESKSTERESPEREESLKEETEGTEEEGESVAETEEDDSKQKIHDGYVLQPGAFNAYLNLGRELGVDEDTDTKFQYQLAMKLQQQQMKRKKKVDFATMTRELVDGEMETDPAMEVVRTAEAATSITKDTGSDPIQEALIEYNQAQQGNVLPPDIFLGLRFGDGDNIPGSDAVPGGREQGRGRSYLNVVDIRASAVLRDIAEKPDEEKIQADVTLKPSSWLMTSAWRQGEDFGALEESLREGLEPPRRLHHDAVTIKMFESQQAGEDRVSVAVMPRDNLRQSKVAMIRRLREMNEQITAIDEMSRNMELDFQNTNILINTIDRIGDAIQAEGGEGEATARSPDGTPKRVVHMQNEENLLAPKVSDKSPVVSARAKLAKTSGDLTNISGLSGISDIIGEIIADGGVDLAEAGLTPAEAEHLARKAPARANERLNASVEKLQQIVKQAQANADKYHPEQRQLLQEWMAEKKFVRQNEYRKRRQELREQEVNPFKSKFDTAQATLTGKALQEAEKDRGDTRRVVERENMTKRLEDAELLLGSILVDKPALPQQTSSPKLARKTASPSAARKGISPAKIHKVLKPTIARKGPTVSLKERRESFGSTRVIQTDKPGIYPTRKGILKTADKPFSEPQRKRQEGVLVFSDDIEFEPQYERTVESSADLMKYAQAVEEMESVDETERESPTPRIAPENDVPVKQYKPKSFREIVRLQRPEVTRKQPMPHSGANYVERLTSLSRQTTAREPSREEKERLYGSKHIPGSAQGLPPSPRRVKTYAERLQEMKPKRKYSTPIVPRQHIPDSVCTGSSRLPQYSRRPAPSGPPHKPLTYVEQLQKINAGATKRFKGGKTTTFQPRTFLKARKPIHKSKTYTEQLQDIQPPKTTYHSAGRPSDRMSSQHGRGMSRARPYGDPYRSLQEDIDEGWEASSVVSEWTVDDDVRQLLYGDVESSVVYTVGGTMSMDYPMSEGVSDYFDYVMGEDYTASVDIDEIAQIADAASVDSGSVLSVIDWDAVDELIADVH